MSAFSFGTSGSTPGAASPLSSGVLNLSGSTPQAKALSSAVSQPFTSTPSFKSQNAVGSGLASAASQNTQPFSVSNQNAQVNAMSAPGFLTAPTIQPSSHTVTQTDASGNTTTTKQTYSPQSSSNSSTSPAPASETNPNEALQEINTGTQGTPLQSNTQSSTSSPFPQITTGLANTATQGNAAEQQAQTNLANTSAVGNQLPNAYAAQTAQYGAGNIPLGQNAEDIANNYSGQIADVAKSAAAGGIGMLTSGALNPIALGRAGAIESQGAQEQQALAAAEGQALAGNAQALTGQGQAATAANEAGSTANTAQSNVQSGLANAGQLANTAQSNVQSGLTSAGQLTQPVTMGLGQYLSSITGQPLGSGVQGALSNYTNYQIAQQNASQGGNFAQQASTLSTSLNQMQGTGQQILGLMGLSGANWSSLPQANQAIQTYMASANPAAQQSIAAGMGEMENYVSQVLSAATGLTPTAVSQVVASYPFQNLSPAQLNDFLNNVGQYGQTKLQGFQQSAQGAYGENGPTSVQPYTGTGANPQSLSNTGTQNSAGVAAAGTAATVGASFFQDLLGTLGGAFNEGAGGAVGGGAATALFGA